VNRWTFASCRMRRMLPTSIDGFKGRAMLGRSNHTAHISAMRSKSRMYSEMERWRSSSASGNSTSKPPLTADHWLAQKTSIEESKTQKGLSAVFRTVQRLARQLREYLAIVPE
jgi:hypothetical protein